ncbi:MAG: hypothetical protein ACLSVD_12950 [Eggerthellaceae bacterium]
MPPFVFESHYVPVRTLMARAYGLAAVRPLPVVPDRGPAGRGQPGVPDCPWCAEDPQTGTSVCTKESLVAALANMGYLGEGEGCVARDFDELIVNFGRAYLLREASGPYSLTNDPDSHPSVVDGVDVPLVLLWESADAIPGGGAIGVIDLAGDEGATATANGMANRTANSLVRSVLDLPVPVGTRIIRDPKAPSSPKETWSASRPLLQAGACSTATNTSSAKKTTSTKQRGRSPCRREATAW